MCEKLFYMKVIFGQRILMFGLMGEWTKLCYTDWTVFLVDIYNSWADGLSDFNLLVILVQQASHDKYSLKPVHESNSQTNSIVFAIILNKYMA